MRTFHHSLSLGTGLAVCIGIGSGHAISAPTLEEVVVTAQKREQNLQDVPIAVSAFSGATLEKTQIFDVSDLAGRAPGFVFQQFNPLESELNIRGIGTIRLDSASADSSVVVFLDETYIGRRGAATQDFFDVERIEVLRGPQGTLYGKNVVGGAINIFTGRPEFETSGKLRLGYGNYESKLVSGYFTGGLTETVAGRLSLHYRDRDGYARNHVLGEDLEDYESYAGRGQLLFELSDNLRVHLRADASKDKTNGMNRHEVDDPFRDGIGPVTAWYPPGADIRDNYAPFPQGSERDIWGVSARVEWDTAAATLTSITAYRDADSINAFDQYGADTPPSLLNSLVTESEDYSAISQELRIASSGESAWSWVAGLYLLREETDKDDGQIENSFLWLIDGPGSTGDFLQGEYLYVQSNVTNNYAAFGEVSYQLTDTLKLTAGIRYTVDEKDYENEGIDLSNDGGTRGAAPLAEAFPNQKLNETWKETTPRVVLEWQAADDKMFYASASKGFKGGGWQGKPANAAAAVVAYDPEIAWNYEIGAKTEWLDRALQVNVAAFFIDYQDLQVSYAYASWWQMRQTLRVWASSWRFRQFRQRTCTSGYLRQSWIPSTRRLSTSAAMISAGINSSAHLITRSILEQNTPCPLRIRER